MTTGPQVEFTGGGVLVAVGLLVGGVLAFKAYKTGTGMFSGAAQAVGQAVDQAAANVQSTWVNSISGPFQQGQDYMNGVAPVVSSKAWLYSDYAYTGQDGSGQLVTDGEWYGNADARRYDAAQPPAARPAATSNNGAAFGVYPSATGRNGDRAYAGGSPSFDEATGTYTSGGGGNFTGTGVSKKW